MRGLFKESGIFFILLCSLATCEIVWPQTKEPQLKSRPDVVVGKSGIPAIPGMQCVTFDPSTLTIEELRNGPQMFGRLHWLYGVTKSQDDRKVLSLIKQSGMNASCWIDDPSVPFHLMLIDKSMPTAKHKNEDCDPYKISDLHIVYLGPGPVKIVNGHGSWTGYRITAGKNRAEFLFAFETEEAVLAAMKAIHVFGLTEVCYYSRPHASFVYLKAE